MPPIARHHALIGACLVLAAALCGVVLHPDDEVSSASAASPRPAAETRADEAPRDALRLVAGKTVESTPLAEDFPDSIVSADGKSITLALPGGGTAKGGVSTLRRDSKGVRYVEGRLTAPEPGRFMFQRQTVPGKAGSVVGFVLFDKGDTAWQVRRSGKDGKPVLVKTTADAVICRAYALPENPEEIPPTHPTDYPIPPDENGVIQLQSLPGAIGVVYLDFDGEERVFDSWGYVNAAPSGSTNAQIYDVWKGVCEDYQPFNLNITTVRAVYDAAPEGRRMHVVITPTTTVAPGSGGVAYVGSFNWSGEMVCWSFYSSGKNAVEVISHEVGHTLGLYHDGRVPAEAYYAGHSGWAPIMGVGYYQTPSQWSRGEYPNANNTEDDLSVIANDNNDVGTRADDHGASFASATWLDLSESGGVSGDGFIGTGDDEDAFRFSTSGGNVTLHIDNVAFNPNLDLMAEILEADGTPVASHDPFSSLDAEFAALPLPAGDYFLRVSGVGKGDLATGYSDYGSLGAYTITGTIDGGVHEERFSIAEHSLIGASVGVVAARADHGAGELEFSISGGNESGVFAIDAATGQITVADNALLDFESLSSQWDDPADFEMFVAIDDHLGVAGETLRVVITVTDENEPPVFPAPSPAAVAEHAQPGTLVTTVAATDSDRFDHVSYSIIDGNTGGAFAIHPDTGAITVAGLLHYETLPSYTLTLRATDHLSPSNTVDVPLIVDLVDIPENRTPGSVVRTFYREIDGFTVAALTTHPHFPGKPHSEAILTSFDSGLSEGDSYGSTIRGYFIAPATGNHTFWISADDSGELRFSPDENPANSVAIASVPARTDPGDWNTHPSQQSVAIPLTAGQVYYIEARHKDSIEGDHVQVAWQGPGMGAPEIIPGKWLAPWLEDYAPWAEARTLVVRESADNGQCVGTIRFIEPDLGQTAGGYAITAGDPAGIFSIHSFSGDISVADGAALTPGDTHVLTVSATDNGSPPMTGETTVTLTVLGLHEQLHAWWKLDESSGTHVADSSGNGRDAALTGGAAWIPRAAANGALQLDGTNARFSYLDNHSLAGDTPFSLAAWVRVPASHAADGMLIQQNESGASGHIGRYLVNVKAGGRINFSVYGKDANQANEAYQFDITGTTAINDGLWHHVACVRDGTTGRIFIDGIPEASASGPVRMLDPTLTVAVGYDARNNNTYLKADVDDVRIYADALGAAQIQRIAGTPKLAITRPASPSVHIPSGVGLLLETAASDPDGPPPPIEWSQAGGPGAVTIGTASGALSTALFPLPGVYQLRAAADDGENSASTELTVHVGTTATSPFAGVPYGGAAGSHLSPSEETHALLGTSSGISEDATTDGFYLLGQAFAGDFDIRARIANVMDVPDTTNERAGLIVRAGTGGAADEAGGFIGLDAGDTGYWIRRASQGAPNTATAYPSMVLPVWCRISRSAGVIEYQQSADGVNWTTRGVTILNGELRAGLCWTSGNATGLGSAVFDHVSGFSTNNTGPLVSAGADAPVVAGIPAELDGSADDDGMPAPPAAIQLAWSKLSGPGEVAFADPQQAATTAVFPAAGDYVLRLTADDGEVATFDDVTLTSAIVNTIGVVASDASAAETGPETATFTLTRGGSLIGDLTVNFTLTGSATNGVDYEELPASVLIPGGETTATLTVTPQPDLSVEGAESVVLEISAGDYDIIAGSAEVMIADSNHAPEWSATPITGADADENQSYAGGSLAPHASDPDGHPLVFTKTSGPGWLEVAADGSLSGTPGADDIGPNYFGVRATDSGGLFADAVWEIHVRYENDAPAFTADPVSAADAMAAIPYAGASLAAHAADDDLPHGDALTFTKLDGPGWLEIAADGSLTGTPQAADIGLNEFTVRVEDSDLAADEATLRVTVTPTVLYLDANGPAPGCGAPTDIVWDGSAIWSADPAGGGGTWSWVNGATAVLSAGDDAGPCSITLAGIYPVAGLRSEEGFSAFQGGGLTLSAPATPFIIAGELSISSELGGSGGLVKSGAGTLSLPGSHNHAGDTVVSAGRLRLNGSLAGAAVVQPGGTLSGSGAIAGGLSIAGTLAPGDEVGPFSTGPLDLAAGARLEWQAADWTGDPATGYDRILAASLDLSGATSVTLGLISESLANFSETPASFVILETTSGISGFDAENITLDASAFPEAAGTWSLRQDGNQLVLDYAPSPFAVWQLEEFGPDAANPLVAGESADPDADSLPNLLEYALATDPKTSNTSPVTWDIEDVAGTAYLRLSIPRNPAATDLTFTVQTTGDLSLPASWTDADTLIETDTPELLVVRDTQPSPPRFIRLKVTK